MESNSQCNRHVYLRDSQLHTRKFTLSYRTRKARGQAAHATIMRIRIPSIIHGTRTMVKMPSRDAYGGG